jgi:hypothetical protein
MGGAFKRWFDVVDGGGGGSVEKLMGVCRAVSNNNQGVTEVPDYLRVVRKSVLKYLYNAIFYNVNYKDLALSNVEHMTNFFMYPVTTTTTHKTAEVYPFYTRMFANTSTVNGGYLEHCFSAIIDGGIGDHPFVTRRDFDLLLIHEVLTGSIKLSRTLCKSYLFKGTYNPLTDVYKCFVMTLKMSSNVPPAVCRWVPSGRGQYTMTAQVGGGALSKRALKMGLAYCATNVPYWTPSKVYSLIEFAKTTDVRVSTTKVPSHVLLSETKGVFLVSTKQGLIINTRDCHPYVYAWDAVGLHRFDNVSEYLYSELGAAVEATVRRVNTTS